MCRACNFECCSETMLEGCGCNDCDNGLCWVDPDPDPDDFDLEADEGEPDDGDWVT